MSSFDILLRLGGVAVLVALNGFFVAAEFALVGARRTRLEQLAEQGSTAAALTRTMQNDLDRYIAAAQLGITLASLALGWIGESTIAAVIEPPIDRLLADLLGPLTGITAATAISAGIGLVISFGVITALHIVLGEQAPKVFAIRSPEQAALFIARPLQLFDGLFRPVVMFLSWATALVLRAFGIPASDSHAKVHTPAELRLLVEESGEAGVLGEEQQEMLINVFGFAERPAYQVMVPRTEVITIDEEALVSDFLDRFAASGHTRFPVLGAGGVDDIVGVMSAKELLVALHAGSVSFDHPITSLIRPAHFTPESKRVGPLLQELRAQHVRLAVLVDEYGGMAGIVTTEDLVEDIMGDLDDEIERDPAATTAIDERTRVVEAQTRIEELNDDFDLGLPEGDYETLAGFILQQLGRLPIPGDVVLQGGLRLTVLEMAGPRIKRVEIMRL